MALSIVAKTFLDILKINPYHDPTNGRFTSAPGGFAAASTIAEARDYAKTQLGFKQVDYSYSYIDTKTGQQVTGTLDIDTVNHINKTITDIQEKYPETKGYVQTMFCTNSNVYAAAVHSGRDASVHLAIGAKAFKDGIEAVEKNWQEDVDIGYHPQGTDANAIFWHEYGHVFASIANMKECGPGATTREKLNAVNNHTAETKWLEAVDSQATTADYGNHISRYAAKDNAELFAESFAAHNTGNGTEWTAPIVKAAGADRR